MSTFALLPKSLPDVTLLFFSDLSFPDFPCASVIHFQDADSGGSFRLLATLQVIAADDFYVLFGKVFINACQIGFYDVQFAPTACSFIRSSTAFRYVYGAIFVNVIEAVFGRFGGCR